MIYPGSGYYFLLQMIWIKPDPTPTNLNICIKKINENTLPVKINQKEESINAITFKGTFHRLFCTIKSKDDFD